MSGKQFATILVITFIVGIIWLVSDILFNVKPSIPENPKLNTLLQPINPNFDPRVLQTIDEEVVEPDSVPRPSTRATPIPASPSPTALPVGSPRISPSPSTSPRPSAVIPQSPSSTQSAQTVPLL